MVRCETDEWRGQDIRDTWQAPGKKKRLRLKEYLEGKRDVEVVDTKVCVRIPEEYAQGMLGLICA